MTWETAVRTYQIICLVVVLLVIAVAVWTWRTR